MTANEGKNKSVTCRRALRGDKATAHNNLGLVLKALGDLQGARTAFQRALDILQRSQLPSDHPYVQSLQGKLLLLELEEKVGKDGLEALLRGAQDQDET